MDHTLEHAYLIRQAAQNMLHELRPDIDDENTVVEAALIIELKANTAPLGTPGFIVTFTSTTPWATLGMLTVGNTEMMRRLTPHPEDE